MAANWPTHRRRAAQRRRDRASLARRKLTRPATPPVNAGTDRIRESS